jgi:hypothetical protein
MLHPVLSLAVEVDIFELRAGEKASDQPMDDGH